MIAHSTGPNFSDNIRQASFYDFHKTPESLPDDLIQARYASVAGPLPGIWDDWSECVRETPAAAAADDSKRARL